MGAPMNGMNGAEFLACPKCGAAVGEWCVVEDGGEGLIHGERRARANVATDHRPGEIEGNQS